MRSNQEQTEYILALRDEKLKAISLRRKIVLSTSLSLAACFVIVFGIGFFNIAMGKSAQANDMSTEFSPSYSMSGFRVDKIVNVRDNDEITKEVEGTKSTATTETMTDESANATNSNNHSDLLLLNASVGEQAIKENTNETFSYNGEEYALYSLKDLPDDVSYYAKNDKSEGLLFTNNKQISYSEFSSIIDLNNFSTSNSQYSAVISKLQECLSNAKSVTSANVTPDTVFRIHFSTQNNLSLNLEILLSETGYCVLKILPAEADVVLAYTIVSYDSSKYSELKSLLN